MKKAVIYAVFAISFIVVNVSNAMIVGGLTHQKQAATGETYSGSILVKNDVNQPMEVKVYQTDYTFDCNGVTFYGQSGQHPRSNANWITFTPHRLLIPPGQDKQINYNIRVPDEPNLVGTYWSIIMVEKIPETSPESTVREQIEEAKISIRSVIRYGIQMITHIGDTGERQLKFLDTKVVKDSEKRVLQVDIENTGQYWLRPMIWAEIYDDAGNYIGRFQGQKRRIYPTTSARYKVDLTQLPSGQYKALVVADSGADYVFGANYNLKLLQ
jgi:hypothetical protein